MRNNQRTSMPYKIGTPNNEENPKRDGTPSGGVHS